MATDKYDLHTIDYSVQGWDAIMTTDMEKLDDVIHSRIIATMGEAIAEFDAVFLAADGKYDQALADGAQQPAVGLALESAVLDDEIRVQRMGPITNVGWAWVTVGVPVYLSDAVLGGLTDVEPAANAQVMGLVLSATSIFIWPDLGGGVGSGLQNVVEDLTPQLGGDLDMNGFNIGGNSEIQLDDAIATKHAQNTDTGTSGNDFAIGNGLAGDKVLTAQNADANKPKLRYNDATNKWQFSNDGVAWNDFGAAGGLNNIVEDVTPELGGQLIAHEFDIKLDSLLSADGKYSGITCDGILSTTTSFGDLLYLSISQKWIHTDADSEANSGGVMLAIALEAGVASDTILLLLQGFVREDDWNFTSYGQALFVGLATGKMVQDISGYLTGDIVRVVGYASTFADQIYFNPSGTWLEIT